MRKEVFSDFSAKMPGTDLLSDRYALIQDEFISIDRQVQERIQMKKQDQCDWNQFNAIFLYFQIRFDADKKPNHRAGSYRCLYAKIPVKIILGRIAAN